jgi:hypothetical protein
MGDYLHALRSRAVVLLSVQYLLWSERWQVGYVRKWQRWRHQNGSACSPLAAAGRTMRAIW